MDLIKDILTSMYRFFEKTQPPKSLKDYTNVYFSRTEGKFISLHLTFQSNKIELHYAKSRRQLLSLLIYI